MTAVLPENECERIAALKRFEILDTPPEEVFDGITRLLSAQLDVPIALVSLVDETRQWFKSRYGLGVDETPREISFCTHAILKDDVMVVADASKDARFKDNPLVTGTPGIQFYAGAPLRTKEGYKLGTLSAIDVKPRALSDKQLRVLRQLARVVVEVMELRQAARSVVDVERDAAKAAEQISVERARELEASEARFNDITTNFPGIVYQFKAEPTGQVSFPYVGASIKDILGLDPAAVVADPQVLFAVVHPDDLPGLEEMVDEARRTLQPRTGEWRATHRSGELRWFRGWYTPRKLDDGSILCNGLILDISELKEAEDRIARAQRMQTVGQLTGGIAHDFNNLLAVIMGNVELLKTQVSGGAAEQLQSIMGAAERGAGLVQRLLAFARRQPLNARPVDAAALLADMRNLLERTLGETIEITVTTADDLWPALVDVGQLENALLNLAINARDAMPEGGTLTIECTNAAPGAVLVDEDSDLAADEFVQLTVRDSGVGIAADVKQHVFEPFFTTKKFGEGSGLGLSMVYGFAKQSGGNVTIDSEEGRGTLVTLYLPRAIELDRDAAPPQEQGEDTPRGRDELILVLEDDAEVRDVAVAMLKGLGYRVIEAADAETARRHLAGGAAVDLVLSDVVLPGGTHGPEFADEARRDYPGLKFVFMSGYAPEDRKQRANSLPGQWLLMKPFTRAKLAKALHGALHAPLP